jgi:restriction system protein
VGYTSAHLGSIEGSDGDYVFDVTARFSALGANFPVLAECGNEQRKVERQAAQVLHSKMQAVGAQKAMLFSISGFQARAIRFAGIHGIALIRLAGEESAWMTKSVDLTHKRRPGQYPEIIGWWCDGNRMSVISAEVSDYTREALELSDQDTLG